MVECRSFRAQYSFCTSRTCVLKVLTLNMFLSFVFQVLWSYCLFFFLLPECIYLYWQYIVKKRHVHVSSGVRKALWRPEGGLSSPVTPVLYQNRFFRVVGRWIRSQRTLASPWTGHHSISGLTLTHTGHLESDWPELHGVGLTEEPGEPAGNPHWRTAPDRDPQPGGPLLWGDGEPLTHWDDRLHATMFFY